MDRKVKPIYTITTVRGALQAGSRAVGFFHNVEEAEEALKKNIMDINECGYYPFAVIESVSPGIYMYPRDEFWYKFNRKTEEYEPCEKPERFKQIIGWSLG